MKIAYIANSRFPSEKAQSDHVMAMCFWFAALGHEVKLFVPDRRPVVAENPFEYYGKDKTFGFERVSCFDTLRWLWLGPLALWIQTATFVYQLRKRLREFNPDVVYSRELYTFGFGRVPGLRVWESHAIPKSSWASRIIRSLDGVATLTRASAERLIKIGVPENKILIEPDAVEPTLFENMPERMAARRKLGISDQEFLCLYTGKYTTMSMPKGLDESIAVVKKLRSRGQPMRLLAVGGTPEELKRYAVQAGEGIELLGHQPQSELKNFYAAADLLLMPFPWTEHYAYFMSPLKMFEYMMSGVPMVVTDLPSVNEIISEQEAFVAKPGDVDSLEQQILKIRQDPAQAHVRARAAKRLAQRYTWQERARRIIDWLRAI